MCPISIGTEGAREAQSFLRSAIGTRLFHVFAGAGLLVALVSVSGCGKSAYELAEVRGTVTIGGRPLTHAKVMFAPVATGAGSGPNVGKPAFGRLQTDGSFILGTYGESDGAVVGPHSVTIIALNERPAPPPAPAIVPEFSRLMVPRQYTVEAGKENQILIEVTPQEVAKFSQK